MRERPTIDRALARRIDRLARRAHAFHRFAHHPACDEYAGEVLRAGRRTRICRGCALVALGAIVGTGIWTVADVPFGVAAAASALALALAVLVPRAAGKLARRFLPAALLATAGPAFALPGGVLLYVLHRRRGPDRTPCAACPERDGPVPCRGYAPIVRRERAFRRRAARLLPG